MNAIENPVCVQIIFDFHHHGLHVKINYEFLSVRLNGQAIISVNLWNEFIYFFFLSMFGQIKKKTGEKGCCLNEYMQHLSNVMAHKMSCITTIEPERALWFFNWPLHGKSRPKHKKNTFIWFTDLFSAVTNLNILKLTFTDTHVPREEKKTPPLINE